MIYPPIRFTRGGLRLELEQGTGKWGHKYVEVHLWLWFPDTGWGWIDAQITDSKPPMLASHTTRLLRIVRDVHHAMNKLKTRDSLKVALTHLSHKFPSKLPDLSFRATEVYDSLPHRSLAQDKTKKPRPRRSRSPGSPRRLRG